MKSTLLIADGDAELCHILQRFLGKCGYDGATASDGLDCLEKLRQERPAVLVLDLGLRWGGGDGVLAWLREETVVSGVAVVLTATTACCPYIEFLSAELSKSPLRTALVQDEFKLVAGKITLPSKPGLGIELNRDALEKYRA
jgi:CheY-like chemotaxis protein